MKSSPLMKILAGILLLLGIACLGYRMVAPGSSTKSPVAAPAPAAEKLSNTRTAVGTQARVRPSADAVVEPPRPAFLPVVNLPVTAPGAEPISDEVLRQIASLQSAKRQRTPVEIKIASPLLDAVKTLRGEALAEGVASLPSQIDLDENGRVLTDMDAKVNEELLNQIKTLGGTVVSHFANYNAIRAWLPLAKVENLAARADVKSIRPADKAETNVGTVTSQGDIAHQANTARTTFSVNGSGVKVGVMSDSTDFINVAQAGGDLGTVTILAGQSGVPGSGEGTAMLEIVHDVAPGAQLFYATGFAGVASFAQNIRDLRFKSGCDIIIDDIGYFNESPFQDAPIAQAVNDVTADGALFFSSASNAGNKNDNQSGTWEGDFVDGGVFTSNGQAAGRIHNFGTGNDNAVVAGGSSRHVDLFWADPLGKATNDYDVYVMDAGGTNLVAKADSTQNGTQDPYEFVNKLEVGQRILIVRFSGDSRYLHLGTGRGRLAVSTSGNTRGHNCAVDAFGVAAVDADTSFPGFFTGGTKNPVENFSSDGQRRVFYRADGTPYTPGNFLATGGVVRQKPDIAAADGVVTTLPLNGGLNPFFGTSAAAPHAGAIAALVKSYNPSLTAAQIRTILVGSALDIEAPGTDRDSGVGLVMALAALQATPGPNAPTITAASPLSGAVGGAVTITGTKFTGATSVKFNGVSATFSVNSATQITTVVPVGATTGKISVTTPTGTATDTANFTILTTPVISSFSPASGPAGATVTISGANFAGITGVRFNGTTATFAVNSSTQITATVPAGATSGRITVSIAATTATSPTNFTITTLPVIAGFSPTSGVAGSSVVITGVNFTGATSVTFNGTAATLTVNSNTQITAIVPVAATSGLLAVTTPAGTGTSTGSFTVVAALAITSFTPANGALGSSVTINGSNFTGTTGVTFNGAVAAFIIDSPTRITATVPAGATSGLIALQKPGSSATSATSFVVIGAPLNDAFAAAQIISGSTGTASGTNVGATKEISEPNHAGNTGGKSVWYRWTATATGVWQLDTIGSNFDTVLAVYTGTSVSNLTQIAANEDIAGATNTVSSLTFAAIAGTTYQIVVDGFNTGGTSDGNATSGAVVLNWTSGAIKPVITGFSPANGPAGTSVVINGANFNGTVAVLFNGVTAVATVNSQAQLTATVPAGATTGPLTVTTPQGSATSATSFAVNLVLSNDDFANGLNISGSAGSLTSVNTGATKQVGEPNHAGNAGGSSVWFNWVAPASQSFSFSTAGSSFDTLLGIYTGTSVAALSTVASNDDAAADLSSRLEFTAVAGTTYRIAVDGYSGVKGNIVLNWSAPPTPPSITSFTPTSGAAGSNVVITGSNFANTSAVRFNGVNALFTPNSATQITATIPAAATTGLITVVTPNGTGTGATNFTITGGNNNDKFANAQTLVGSAALATGDNSTATKEIGEPNHAGNTGGKSLWYFWTAPTSGAWVVDLSGSDFDTTLGIYTGTSVNALTLVASADDSSDGITSSVFFTATSGVTYRFAVDGYGGATGNVVLRILPAIQPTLLYRSSFEQAVEGFNPSFTLAGQNSWTSLGTGGNGLLDRSAFGLGQSAYIGFFPPSPVEDTFVWRPLNHTPDIGSSPVVRFTTLLQIVDSTTNQYDDFEWQVYNINGDRLFSINFDNSDLSVYTQLDGAGGYVDTGVVFQNGLFYELDVTMDFARNRWSATFDGEFLANELEITTTGAALTLGDIDAAWLPGSNPGDNYMVFDNYQVSTEPSAVPNILVAPQSQTVTEGARVVLGVVATANTLLSYQWLLGGIEISGETGVTLTLESVNNAQAGNYSVRVSSFAGSTVSTAGIVTVSNGNMPPAVTTISNKLVHAGTLLSFTAAASDADLPTQNLTFTLAPGAPVGAGIAPATGVFSWTPSTSQIGQTYPIGVVVTDSGSPARTSVASFNVNVGQPFAISNITRTASQVTLTWTTLAGKTYQVQHNASLDNAWLNLGPPRTAIGNTLSTTETLSPTGNLRQFYRISTTD